MQTRRLCILVFFVFSSVVAELEQGHSVAGGDSEEEEEGRGAVYTAGGDIRVSGGDFRPTPEPLSPPNFNTPYGYQIISQSRATAGETVTVTVHARGAEKRKNYWPLNVTIDIVNGTKILVDSSARTLSQGQSAVFTLELPKSTPAGFYVIRVRMTSNKGESETFLARLTISSPSRTILVQTDKQLYRPGDTVLGRAIIMNSDLTGITGKTTFEIKLQNPARATVALYETTTLSGVAGFNFSLIAESMLGEYRVCVTHEDRDDCSFFRVENFDVPMLSCSIASKDDHLPCFGSDSGDRNIRRKVCYTVSARNARGQKVKGRISATAAIASRNACPNSKQIVKDDINGVKTVCIDVCSSSYVCYDEVRLEANVTDSTGNEVACQGTTSIEILGSPYFLEIEDSQDDSFYPCETSRYSIKTTTFARKPYAGATVNFTCQALMKNDEDDVCGPDSKEIFSLIKTTGSDGRAKFEFCAPCNALEITCSADAVNESANVLSVYRKGVMIYSPERVLLQPWKPARSLPLKVGSMAKLRAFLTHPRQAEVFVMNGGTVLRTLSCRPKRIVAGLVGKPDVCDKGGRQFQYYCLLRFVVTPAMAPKVIIVFSQKDLSGDVYTWSVASRPKNTLSLKFSKSQVKPGKDAILKIQAAEGSSVSILAIDQSSHSQLADVQRSSRLNTYTFDSSPFTHLPREFYECGAADHWYCYCETYGCSSEGSSTTDGRAKKSADNSTIPPPCASSKCIESVCRLVGKCQYVSTLSFLKAAGLDVLSNFKPKAPVCAKPKPKKGYSCCPFRIGDSDAEIVGGVDSTDFGSDAVLRQPIIYPKTWIWTDIQLEPNVSKRNLAFTVPEEITTWTVSGFALSSVNAINFATPASLRVFQPFVVSLTVPPSATRGERVEVRATVFNYLNDSLTVYVRLNFDSKEINVVESELDRKMTSRRKLEVPENESRSTTYFLTPLKIGCVLIECTAKSQGTADTDVKALSVQPGDAPSQEGPPSLPPS